MLWKLAWNPMWMNLSPICWQRGWELTSRSHARKQLESGRYCIQELERDLRVERLCNLVLAHTDR